MKNTLFLSILILLGVAGMPATPHAQTRHYVHPQAQGQNNGTTWNNAFTDLQTALDVAAPGDEVWVAEGIYLPTSGVGRDKRFSFASNVKLYGGFAGSETDLTQRDHEAHPTVLSGNIGSPTDSTDNVYTILYLNNPEAETRIDGLVFEGGYAHSDTTFVSISPTLSGGAVYVQAKNGVGLPVFANCTFRNNSAKVNGGAVFVYGQNSTQSMPLFHFCRFENNAAGGAGGAVHIIGGSEVDRGIEFRECVFDNNKAIATSTSQAGGIYYKKNIGLGEQINIFKCEITKNVAKNSAGFLVVQLNIGKSNVLIDSCSIIENASDKGGSVYGEIVFIPKETYFSVSNSLIKNNQIVGPSSTGQTVFNIELNSYDNSQLHDTIIFIKNQFFENTLDGPRFISDFAFFKVVGNDFRNNTMFNLGFSGSRLIFKDNIIDSNATLYTPILISGVGGILNNLITNNIINSIGAVFIGLNDSAQSVDSISIINNTIYNNKFNDIGNSFQEYEFFIACNNMIANNHVINTNQFVIPIQQSSGVFEYFSHNLTDVPCEGFFDPAVCGTGNIVTSDPGFRDAANGGFRLMPCSPAVNAGDNDIVTALGITTDLDGAQRIKDGLVDMGAYESPTLAEDAEAEVQAACIGQNNGAVTFDLPSGCPPFDFAWSSPPASGADTTGLTPGLYTFTVTDQKGKVMVQTLVVQEASPLSTLSDVTPATCSTCADGSIIVSSVSGDAPFTFLWSNGAVGQLANGLLPGVYSLTISDAWGCDTVLAFEVPFTIATTEQEDAKPAPSVWPNPCRDVLYLDWQGASRWSLVASDGKVVQRLNLSSTNRQGVNLLPLPAGIYLSIFEMESGQVHQSSVVLVR